MSRPDAMDLDVAALLGLDVAKFAQAPAAPRTAKARVVKLRAARPRGAVARPSSPWLWVIVPLAAALVAGLGMSWRSEKVEPVPEQAATRTAEPVLKADDAPRAMSLKIIDGPRRAATPPPQQRPRPRNIPMSELGPLPASVVASHVAELEPTPAEAPSSAPAPEAPVVQHDPVRPMALFEDQELAPPAQAAAPEAGSEP